MTAGTVLHFSPHPDDELIGAPATLFALRDAGWRIVNVVLSLGREAQWGRRERELREACARARFELVIPDGIRELAHLGDGEVSSEEHVGRMAAAAMERYLPELVVSPSRHDRHPGHEVVARAVQTVLTLRLQRGEVLPRWWMWGIWADLPLPTVITAFDRSRLDEILACLAAYEGELARNQYGHFVSGRASFNAIVGCERVFGFGTDNHLTEACAEVVCEVQGETAGGEVRWLLGRPRVLDVRQPLQPVSDRDVSFWMSSASISEQLSGLRPHH